MRLPPANKFQNAHQVVAKFDQKTDVLVEVRDLHRSDLDDADRRAGEFVGGGFPTKDDAEKRIER